MTAWSEILTGPAMTIIDDVRWREELAANPARFFRAKSQYISLALPMLARPPELLHHLQAGMTDPEWADSEWTSTENSLGEETTVSTGFVGYELFSCEIFSADGLNSAPYDGAVYDPVTGDVTFPVQEQAGIRYAMDFYTDGKFSDLTATQMRLFALAVAIVWDERFDRNWLNIQAKIHDASFDPPNEANYMKQANARKKENRAALDDALRKYEQDCAFASAMKDKQSRTVLI